MADTSRKRSRKSKLVPRECAVFEDDLELQLPMAKIPKKPMPPSSYGKQKTTKKVSKQPESNKTTPEETTISPEVDTSVLRKINASSAKVDTESIIKASPRKFEINIEVESCDDDDDEFASIRVENELTPAEDLPSTNANAKPISLSREHILDEADNILETSTEVADKILSIHLRNTIGYEQKEKLKIGVFENRIQSALDEWKRWQNRSFHREDPLFYKCYICTRSWWFLSDFRNHLSSAHPNDNSIKILLEKYETHEANLIAYYDRLVAIKDIYTEGLCHRCGKDYAAHELGGRYERRFYKNEGCPKQFFTCMGLRDHIQSCPVCKVEDKPHKCDICKSRFDTKDEVTNHLGMSHSVRSDIPIMAHNNECWNCSEKYICRYLHKCWQNDVGPLCECPHCFRTFSNNMSLELHKEHSNKPFECEVCELVLRYSCKKYEHMLTHTDKYMAVRKCDKCKGLNVFLNNDDAAAHSALEHESRDPQKQIFFPKLVVPSSCVYKSLAESQMAEEEEALAEQQRAIQQEKELLAAEQRLHDLQESTTEFTMDEIVVKEEPQDYEDSPGLIIKEEPIDETESQIQNEENDTDNFEHQITVKEEFIAEEEGDIEEEEEFDGDIIKLNFNIEDLLVKQESITEGEEYSQEPTDTQTEDDESSQEFPLPIKEEAESILEPEVILKRGSKRRENKYRCSKCGYTANHKQYRAHLEFDCPKNPMKHRDYFCSKCNTTFSSMKKYLSHFESHGYKNKACPECLNQFDNYSGLGSHVQSHIKQNFVRVKMITHAGRAMIKPDFQCKKCMEKIPLTQFFEHWETHINSQPTHPIKVTSRPPAKRGELHETIIKECIARLHKTPKECNHCHRWFKRVNECKRHIIEHLLVDAYNHKHIFNELKCQICETGFGVPEKYKQHMRDHASLPVYKCELCDRTFSDSSNFTKHKKVHNLRVIICDLCGKKFQSKVSLEKHIEKHKTTEPITCELCNKIFYFDSSYRRHKRYYHERTTHGFRCVNCGLRFTTLKLKWDHMWSVHRERKHKADCPICHESFRKFSDVRTHAKKKHLMEVSVLSVKRASNRTVNVDKFVSDATTIKVGRAETLVVFDSD